MRFSYDLAGILVGIAAVCFAVFQIFLGPRVVGKLIARYLLKRRIAWVSLIAVTLCTTMVLVVISVMGGWLRMFRASFHGLSGDVIVEGPSLAGFPYYQQMIDRIEALDGVEAAVPTIRTFGLIQIGNKQDGVQVLGFPVERMGLVNNYPQSLYRQHTLLVDEAKEKGIDPIRRELLLKKAAAPPSFRLRTESFVPLDRLLGDLKPGASLGERVTYDEGRKALVIRAPMTAAERNDLLELSSDPTFQEAVRLLYEHSRRDIVDYRQRLPNARGDVTRWPGMIAGAGVLEIKKNSKGEIVREPWKYELPARLTVMGISPSGAPLDVGNKAERNYWIVDDSWTGVWQYDASSVYVPFERLQEDLGMGEQTGTDKETGEKFTTPARTTDIHVKIAPGRDLGEVKGRIQDVVEQVIRDNRDADELLSSSDPSVETWEEDKATYLNAIENEKVLVTFLFGIISVVAIFLIFCIFYMIVVEKTKDIGIIKSVGATAAGVAGIFLGYGAAIGIVGAGLGLLVSYLIVTYINEIHTKLGDVLGIQIWNPEVYLFDKIPNTMDPKEVVVIVGCAVVASVLGALVPALRAARMNPVEALRWE